MNWEFIETEIFTKIIKKEKLDKDLRIFQNELLVNPDRWPVIQSCGIRKGRLKPENSGKSGGYRVFYYKKELVKRLYLLYIINKKEQANIRKEFLDFIVKEYIQKIDVECELEHQRRAENEKRGS